MNIEIFWAQARPAVRVEALQIAGVPKEAATVVCWTEWAELRPLTIAMLERAWDNSAVDSTATTCA